jgi:hypothetical protein
VAQFLQQFSPNGTTHCIQIKHRLKIDPILEKMWQSRLTIVSKPHGMFKPIPGGFWAAAPRAGESRLARSRDTPPKKKRLKIK